MAPPMDSNPIRTGLKRSISMRQATTPDDFIVYANKHYTDHIQSGTLQDAIRNGFIDSHDAMIARTIKARRTIRELCQNKRRELNVSNEAKAKPEPVVDETPAPAPAPASAPASADVDNAAADESMSEDNEYSDTCSSSSKYTSSEYESDDN